MPIHTETRRLPYSAQQIFDLVADVERYPDFLPWCRALTVHTRSNERLEATMIAGYGILKDSFTSEVALTSPSRIEVAYKDGPFRYLHNTWSFNAHSEHECEVVFHIDFAFRSGLFNRAMASFFSEAVSIMVQAFENRAHQLYGACKKNSSDEQEVCPAHDTTLGESIS